MYKYGIVLLCTVMIGLLILSSAQAQDATATAEPTHAVEPEKVWITDLGENVISTHPWRVVYIAFGPSEAEASSSWFSAIKSGLEQGAVDFNIALEIMYPDCDVNDNTSDCSEAQIQLLAALLEQDNIDGIIVKPNERSRLVPVIERFYEQGIPVVIEEDINTDKVTTKVMFDEQTMGETLGRWVAQHAETEAHVLILEGPADAVPVRRLGLLDGLATNYIIPISIETANWSSSEAYQITMDVLTEDDNLDVIVSQSDSMMIGALQALTEAHQT